MAINYNVTKSFSIEPKTRTDSFLTGGRANSFSVTGQAAASSSGALARLSDVSLSSIPDGSFLKYGASTGKWSAHTLNESQWDIAYNYSQVGHLPLAGGTVFGAITVGGALVADSINTGQGVTEVHLMNQNLRTTDDVTFDIITATEFSGTATNALSLGGVIAASYATTAFVNAKNVSDFGGYSDLFLRTGNSALGVSASNDFVAIDGSGNLGYRTLASFAFDSTAFDDVAYKNINNNFTTSQSITGNLTATGDIGIGTPTPETLAGYRFITTANTSGGGLVMYGNGTRNAAVYSANTALYNEAVGNIKFLTGGSPLGGATERLEINNNGIDVAGTITATGGNSTQWNTAYGWGDWSTGVNKAFVDALGVDADSLGGSDAINYALKSYVDAKSVSDFGGFSNVFLRTGNSALGVSGVNDFITIDGSGNLGYRTLAAFAFDPTAFDDVAYKNVNNNFSASQTINGNLTTTGTGSFGGTLTINTTNDFKIKLIEGSATINHILTGSGFYGISGAAGYILSMNAGSQNLEVGGDLTVKGSSIQPAIFATTSTTTLYTTYRINTSTDVGYIGNGNGMISGGGDNNFGIRAQADLIFAAGGNSERMRIDSSGNTTINGNLTATGTSDFVASSGTANVKISGWNAIDWTGNTLRFGGITAGQWNVIDFDVSGSNRASVTGSGFEVTGTLTIANNPSSYWTIDRDNSDGRLKWLDTGTERMSLSTSGNLTATGTITSSGTTGQLRLGTNPNDYATLSYSGGGTSLLNNWANTNAYVDVKANGVGLRVLGSGNVGIGTSSPNGKVTVFDDMISSSFTNTDITVTKTSYGSINFQGANQDFGATGTKQQGITWQVNDYGSSNADYGVQAAIAVSNNGDVGTQMGFFTSNNYSNAPVERIRISSNGNVGIGTNNPSARMTVEPESGNATAAIFRKTGTTGGGTISPYADGTGVSTSFGSNYLLSAAGSPTQIDSTYSSYAWGFDNRTGQDSAGLFYISPSGTFSTRMRIDSLGNTTINGNLILNGAGLSRMFLQSSGTTIASVYANSIDQFGFLDKDGNWFYRGSHDSQHEWLINNDIRAKLNSNAFQLSPQVSLHLENTGSPPIIPTTGISMSSGYNVGYITAYSNVPDVPTPLYVTASLLQLSGNLTVTGTLTNGSSAAPNFGGGSGLFVKADGSFDSNTYLTLASITAEVDKPYVDALGVNADTVDGYHASTAYSQNTAAVRDANGYIFTSWHHLQNGTGLYQSQGNYFYSSSNGWNSRSASVTISETLYQNSSGTTLGYVYSNTSNEIGFLNSSSQWTLKTAALGIEVHANASTIVQAQFKTADDGIVGYIYGGGNEFGLLDGDGNWMYRMVKDSVHDWRVNNVTKATLDNTDFILNTRIRSNYSTTIPSPRFDNSFYVLQSQHWYGHTGSETMYLGEAANTISLRGDLDVGGNIALNGVQFFTSFTDYHALKDRSGNVAIYLGGAATPANYYDNDTHYFRNRLTSATYATLNSTSLTLSSAIKTAAPSGGTAKTWKLGNRVGLYTVALDTEEYVEVEIEGHGLVKLAVVNTTGPV